MTEYEVFEPDDRDVEEFGKEALAAAFSNWCYAVTYNNSEEGGM